jgi:hypothetical protein
MPPAMIMPKPRPTIDPTNPSTMLSMTKRRRICARVPPSARMIPISVRRSATPVTNEL